jgi:hypothetical protein
MERLTYFKDGHYRLDFGGVQYQADFVDRLAAYEDSKLSPEDAANLHAILRLGDGMTLMRLRELAVADKDGRVVVLPCKVGDTVYRLQYIEQTPRRITVGVVPIKFALIWLEEFGKTVFLTREEAEKALAELEGRA